MVFSFIYFYENTNVLYPSKVSDFVEKISDNAITLYYSKIEKHIFHIHQKNLSKYLYLKYLKYLKYYYNT